MIEEVGKATAGVLTRAGSYKIGKDVLDYVKEHAKQTKRKENEKLTRDKTSHENKKRKAEAVYSSKGESMAGF